MQNDIFIKVEFFKPNKAKGNLDVSLLYLFAKKVRFISATIPILSLQKHKRMSKIRGIKHGPGSRMSSREGSPLSWAETSNTIHILVISWSDIITGRCGR